MYLALGGGKLETWRQLGLCRNLLGLAMAFAEQKATAPKFRCIPAVCHAKSEANRNQTGGSSDVQDRRVLESDRGKGVFESTRTTESKTWAPLDAALG